LLDAVSDMKKIEIIFILTSASTKKTILTSTSTKKNKTHIDKIVVEKRHKHSGNGRKAIFIYSLRLQCKN